ncbi:MULTISPECIES: hypothetical protein [unclassified Microcoleus]
MSQVIYLTLPVLTIGVADLWYEKLYLQKLKEPRQNIFGIPDLSIIFIP